MLNEKNIFLKKKTDIRVDSRARARATGPRGFSQVFFFLFRGRTRAKRAKQREKKNWKNRIKKKKKKIITLRRLFYCIYFFFLYIYIYKRSRRASVVAFSLSRNGRSSSVFVRDYAARRGRLASRIGSLFFSPLINGATCCWRLAERRAGEREESRNHGGTTRRYSICRSDHVTRRARAVHRWSHRRRVVRRVRARAPSPAGRPSSPLAARGRNECVTTTSGTPF